MSQFPCALECVDSLPCAPLSAMQQTLGEEGPPEESEALAVLFEGAAGLVVHQQGVPEEEISTQELLRGDTLVLRGSGQSWTSVQQTLVDTRYAMEVSQGQSQIDIVYATEKFEVPAWIVEVAADCSAHGSHVLNFEGLGMVRQVPWLQGQVFLQDFFGRRSRSWIPSLPLTGGWRH